MKVIDLTHKISEDMPAFPGDPSPRISLLDDYDMDGWRESQVILSSHTGTHIDAQAHVIPGGKTLDQYPIDSFVGKAAVIDCRDFNEIDADCLEPYGSNVYEADFLLFYTNWDRFWGEDAYYNGFPTISDDLLQFIIDGDYNGIGFDMPSFDPIEDETLQSHKKLFENSSCLIIESLTNLGECPVSLFEFSCLPLKIKNADGSPVRAVAMFE